MLTATLQCNLPVLAAPLSQNDTGIDQAVYVPAAGAHPAFIAGVRGGYVLKFDPGTGAYQSAARFCSPNFGDGAICYDSDHDKLIASFWNEQSAKSESHDARGLYKINPATLAVELFTSSASLGTNIPEAIHNLLYFNATAAAASSNPTSAGLWAAAPNLRQFDPVTFLPGTVDPGPVAAGAYYPIWTDLAMDLNLGNAFQTEPITQRVLQQPGAQQWYTNTAGSPHATTSGNFDAYGVCVFLPPASSQSLLNFFYYYSILYITTRDGKVYYYATNTPYLTPTFDAWNPITLPTSTVTPVAYHIRYNPFNGKIYVPDVAGNQVYVIAPNWDIASIVPSPYYTLTVTNPITATYTGFDSPIDVVFTPSGSFAVQQGLVGLKQFE
jgi:hypothetical protein